MGIRQFTREELVKFDGKNGVPAYVAYCGKVYDVSTSFLWKEGRHQVLHGTGVDLTEAMRGAPHNEDVLKRFPVVGILQNSE